MSHAPWISEEFAAARVSPAQMDILWSRGWRHFGRMFFRYNVSVGERGMESIIPLRVRLDRFTMTKNQRRIWRRNEDITWELRPAAPDAEIHALFDKHVRRFDTNIPESLGVFLGNSPDESPCECLEIRASVAGRLIAVSFLDIGRESVSSIYAIFDPEESRRSPGILTMLKEMEWARQRGMKYHHPGYATPGPGIYEYKKQFLGLEGYDWSRDEWQPWAAFEPHRADGKAEPNAAPD